MKNSKSYNDSIVPHKNSIDDFAQAANYTLYDIANAIRTTHNLKKLYHSIYSSLNKLMELPNFFIAHYDEQTQMIDFQYFIDEHDEDFPIIESDDGPSSLTGEVIQAKRPLLLKENKLLKREKNNRLVGTTPKIWLGVPLIIQGRITGVISIQHYTNPDYFSHRHLEILVCVSELLSMAIEKKQLLENLENEKELLHLVADHVQSIIFMINSTGIYKFANPSHLKLGYTPDEMLNTSFLDLAHPDHTHDILEFLEKGIQGRVFQNSLTFRMKNKSGTFTTLDGIFNIIRNHESILEKIIFIGQIIEGKKAETQKETTATATEKSAFTTEPSAFQRLKNILIIEDDETVRSMTAKAIKIHGYNPIEARDGERGLDIYKISHHSIDAIFLDIILPGICGVDTFKEIVKINPHAKIIITSGHVTGKDQQKLFSNAVAFIEKPYGIMTIRETLMKIFKNSNQKTDRPPNHLIPF